MSEIMLQQTQVKTVIPYFERFITKFPTVFDLANAPLDEVLMLWAGLGYYARARNLHKMAGIIASKYKGRFPRKLEALKKLPGLGRSTSSAILAICFSKKLPILDGNVKRVLTRYLGISGYPGDRKIEAGLWLEAEKLMPQKNIPTYTQAIMDLGALVCTYKNPSCLLCPIQKHCVASHQGLIEKLPTRKAKAIYPTKKSYFLMLTNRQGIYLECRPTKGIWGGLWCLPEFHHFEDIKTWCNLRKLDFEVLAERTHLFTHYRLQFTPVVVEGHVFDKTIDFPALINYGMPTPIKRLIDDYIASNPSIKTQKAL